MASGTDSDPARRVRPVRETLEKLCGIAPQISLSPRGGTGETPVHEVNVAPLAPVLLGGQFRSRYIPSRFTEGSCQNSSKDGSDGISTTSSPEGKAWRQYGQAT